MSEKVVLGYWGIRGRAQVIRHLLCYCGIQFEEKLYSTPQAYAQDMAQCGIDFPNLPYMIDGDLKFSQTLAIARYVIRKSGKTQLLGKNPQDEAMINNINIAFGDIWFPIIGLFFNKKVNDIKAPHFYKTKQLFNKMEKFLQGKQFAFDYLSMADFFIAEGSYYIQKMYPEEYNKFKGINRIRTKIMELPQVKAYYEREQAVLTPFLPPYTAIPFFWPGTQPKAPPPPPTINKTPSNSTPQKKASTKQQAPPKQGQNSSQIKQQQAPIEQPINSKPIQSQEPKYFPPPQQEQFYQSQNGQLKVCVISGSLSGNSSINYFLQKLTSFGHPSFQYQWADISNLQIHNQDIEQQGTDNANNLRGQVYNCHAVLIGVSNTHNLLSSALTNAYNWLIPVIRTKPVGLVSLQCPEEIENSLRDSLKKENIPFLQNIYFGVNNSSEFFDDQGQIHQNNWNKVKGYFNSFAQFIEYVNQNMSTQQEA